MDIGHVFLKAEWGGTSVLRPFFGAQEYGMAQLEYRAALRNTKRKDVREGRGPIEPPRVDLELEAFLQILNEERFVTCHSYRQDEINMLMHVADSLGFRLNTFTHILEGHSGRQDGRTLRAGGSSSATGGRTNTKSKTPSLTTGRCCTTRA